MAASSSSAAAGSSGSCWGDGRCLPDLVLSLIFRRSTSIANKDCSARQSIQTLAKYSLVCKQWHHLIYRELAEDTSLWRSLAAGLSPCFALDNLLFWLGERPSWLSASKLHCAWSKAFSQADRSIGDWPEDLPMDQKLEPELCKELSELALPPVAEGYERLFVMAVGGHSFAVQQRYSVDLSNMVSKFISYNFDDSISSLSAYRDRPYVLSCSLFWGMHGDRCGTRRHCSKAMHQRTVCRSQLPTIFAARGKGLTVVQHGDSSHVSEDNDVVIPSTSHNDIHGDLSNVHDDGSDNMGHRDDKGDCKSGKMIDAIITDKNCNNSNQYHHCKDECETVYVVHNVDGNLECDLWIVFEEPLTCTYWKKLLIYISLQSSDHFSSIVKCVEAGMDGSLLWCADAEGFPNSLEVNSQFVAMSVNIIGGQDPQSSRLILLSVQNGEMFRSIDVEFSFDHGLSD